MPHLRAPLAHTSMPAPQPWKPGQRGKLGGMRADNRRIAERFNYSVPVTLRLCHPATKVPLSGALRAETQDVSAGGIRFELASTPPDGDESFRPDGLISMSVDGPVPHLTELVMLRIA